jgi:zinc transporter, ZIP family
MWRQCWDRTVGCTTGSDLNTLDERRAWRVTMLLFVSLLVHNFPEGLAVAASTMHSQSLGWTTTIAIALHNIPEGIAIAIPCRAARPDAPCLAFFLASISGLAEPLGALVAVMVLKNNQDSKKSPSILDQMWEMGNVLAFVAGKAVLCCRLLASQCLTRFRSCSPT